MTTEKLSDDGDYSMYLAGTIADFDADGYGTLYSYPPKAAPIFVTIEVDTE